MPVSDKDFAMIVGVNHYPRYRSLKGAINDAKSFQEWVVDIDRGGGVPSDHSKLVLSSENPTQPVQDNIDEELEGLFNLAKANTGGRLYLYFSGHGLARNSISTDLCMPKWSMVRRHNALDAQAYLTLCMDSGYFSEVVLFTDCCRVYKVNTHGQVPTLGQPAPGEAGATRSFTAYASEFQSAAFEATMDGSGEVRGHFTRALLSGLWGAAADDQGGVTAHKLKGYLEAETPRIAKEHGHKQEPVVNYSLRSTPESRFGAAEPLTDARIEFVNRQGTIVLEDPNLEEIKKDDATTGPWNLQLTKGLHNLREESTGEEKEFRVRFNKHAYTFTF